MVKGYDRFTANGIVNRVKGLGQKILDGTVLMKDYTEFQEATGHTYNEIQNLLYMITWDIISLSEYTIGKGRKPRTERLAEITKLCENTNRVQIIHGIKATTYEEICQFFSEQLALGLEGAIVKSSDGKWVDGKPVHQIKMKLEFVSDLRIVGFNEGKADTKFEGLLGSVQCESEDGLLKTDVSGFTDDEREYIWFHKDEFDRAIMGTKCNGLSKASDNEHFSMMYAVANRVGKELDIRTDKSVANTFEEIQQIESSKKNG
jgi:ATP-dependent DNA ligase